VTKKYASGQTVELEIKKIVPRGFGIAFTEGLTVFVPLAAPGDVLRVRLTQVKGKTAFAEIAEVLLPSPARTVPPCQYYGVCGGCDLQHLRYSEQLSAKISMVDDALRRIGKVDLQQKLEIVGSPNEFGYRSRAVWHADRERRTLGYFRRGTHDVVDIETCPIVTPELDAELHRLRHEIEWEGFIEESVAIEAASAGGEVSVYSSELIEPTNEIAFRSDGETYRFNARSFFQANQTLIPELINYAVGDASGTSAFDLYCGVGLFSLPLARKFGRVLGVEGSLDAVAFAKANAAAAELDNVEFFAASVDGFLAEYTDETPDLVVLDPPRSGTEKGVIERLIALAPPKIAFIACDPSMLARDLNRLIAGGYVIDDIKLFDLFPQTHHVETIAKLSRK
jgi:tRNA/tmRNA/rRNA uracil-C5-methylase (TrmA/RlmC/RlmD family)